MTGTPAAWICSDIHIYIYDPLLTKKPKIRSEDTGMNVRELKRRLKLKEKALVMVRNFESFHLKRHGHKFYGNISNMKTLFIGAKPPLRPVDPGPCPKNASF